MMITTPITHAIWAYISSAWVDISADVIHGSVRGSWGMYSNHPLDRIAGTGEMTFDMNNSATNSALTAGYYSPAHASVRAGWKVGIPVKLVETFDNATYIRFRGIISTDPMNPGIRVDVGSYGNRRVHITVLDWMDYAAKYPLVSPGIKTNQTGDEALHTLLHDIPIPPQLVEYAVGAVEFPTSFDTVTTRTKAYSEMSKIAFSEFGYIYLRKDRTYGEKLIFESCQTRSGLDDLSLIPKMDADCGRLLLNTGDYILLNTGDKFILNETTTFSSDNTMSNADVTHGENVINRITCYAYPRKLGTPGEVLFTLSTPQFIQAGETIELRGNYANPSGGNSCNGMDVIEPDVAQDYEMWTGSDGTGTDKTANLTISAEYGAASVTYTLTNDSTKNCYITKLQARGTGIYLYNPIESAQEDSDSINEVGYQPESLYQKYLSTLDAGKIEAAKILELNRTQRTTLNKVTFIANASDALMMAWLNVDVGSLVEIKEDQAGIDGWYYVQGVEFQILGGGAVKYTWLVVVAFSLLAGNMSPVAVSFGGGAAEDSVGFTAGSYRDGIGFGSLPYLTDQSQRSMSAWVYLDTVPSGTYDYGCTIIAIMNRSYGAELYIDPNGYLEYESRAFVTPGYFENQDVFATAAWKHVVVTYNTDDAKPKMYINGVEVDVTIDQAPSGAMLETGAITYVGNAGTGYSPPWLHPFDGKIKDARIYNRILTQAEVTTLYNSGTPDTSLVTDGLMFQAPVVRTADLTYFTDHTMVDGDYLRDNIFGAVGTPNGSPITRLP